MRIRLALLSFSLLAVLGLGACGGDDTESPPPGTPQTEDALRDSARAASEALFAGELREAYETFSAACREATTFGEFRSSVTLASAIMEAFTGSKLEDFVVTDVRVRNFSGSAGEVLVVAEDPANSGEFGSEDDWITWAFEEGQWVQTDCDDIGLNNGEEPSNGAEPTTEPTPAATMPPAGQGPAIGTAVEAGGSRYTVNGMEDPGKADDNFAPDPGNRWVVFDVTQEAVGGEDSASPWDFSVQDVDGFMYEWTFGLQEPEFPSQQLAGGQRVRGYVTFEIPEGAELAAVFVQIEFGRPLVMIADLTR